MGLTDAIGENDDSEGATDLFRVIGRQVRLLRERAGLTQRELGERLGYSEDLVRSLEGGRRTPQPEFLDAARTTRWMRAGCCGPQRRTSPGRRPGRG